MSKSSRARCININTHKGILVQLLVLIIFVFANCDTKLVTTPISVDSNTTQEVVQRETLTFDEQDDTGLVQESKTNFFNLPIELQAHDFCSFR